MDFRNESRERFLLAGYLGASKISMGRTQKGVIGSQYVCIYQRQTSLVEK